MIRNASSTVSPEGILKAFQHVTGASHRTVVTETNRAPRTLKLLPPSSASRSNTEARFDNPRSKLFVKAEESEPRSRVRYVQRGATEDDEKHFLRPAVLSERLKKLCDQDRLDDAVVMLKNAPLDAQNTIVWNTLMAETMKARKYKLAYTLYIDMKRRGLKPNLRTFVTILTGYSRIDDWDTHTKQLANVHTLFDNYKQFVEAVREQDSRSPDISRVPYILYIKILGDATLYQKMFDVFYAMDQEGPLSPDHFIYATLLHAIADRRVLSEGSQEPVSVQNASDAKLVWKQMVKASEKLGFPIDAYALTGVLKALSGGRPTDQLLAFDIVRDYVGLSKPGETALPTKVPLNDFILQVVLGLCIVTRKYRLCMHYFQQVIDRPTKPGQERIITWRHMEQVLRAYVAIAALGSMGEANQALETLEWMLREEIKDPNSGYKIRPRLETYGLVLSACWRGADWVSATRTFELMTGYNGKDFRDGKTGAPRMEKRSKGRNIMPNSAVLSTLARAAVASKDRANMRQCLRIIDHLQGAEFFVNVNETRKGEAHPNELVTKAMIRGKWEVKDRIFYNLKLASAIVELTDNATPKGKSRARLEAAEGEGVEDKGYVISANEEQQWTALKMKAKDYIKRTPAPRPGSIPIMEKEPLGPAKFITNTDNQVEYQMTHRHIKSI